MCKGSSSTQTNSALPQYAAGYSQLFNQAQNTASQPYQPYTGQLVAPFNDTQNQAFGTISNTTGASGAATADPYYSQAQSDFSAATTPLWDNVQQFSPSAVQQYESPYTSDVVNATENQFANTNAQQFNQAAGSAAAAGAFGGDRYATLESQLAGQQQASEAPVIANLENTGYNTALGEFNNQQQSQLGANEANAYLNSQAGFGEEGLGTTAQNEALAGANTELNAGNEQQALAQENLNVPYEQYLAQQAYPFQTESWLSGIETGLGGAAGSTSTSQQQTSLLSQILGGAESGAGILGETGAFGNTGWLTGSSSTPPSYAMGPSSSSYDSYYGGGEYMARGGHVPHRDGGGGIFGGVPDVDVNFMPSTSGIAHNGPPKANAKPAQSGGGGGSGGLGSLVSAAMPFIMAARRGGGISNVIPFPAHRARGGRGIAGFASGGDTANDDGLGGSSEPNVGTLPAAATGTDDFDAMPYPNVDFTPRVIPDNSAAEMKQAPWEALLDAGATTLATGNIGAGIAAGAKGFQGARKTANADALEAAKEGNEEAYKQADVEEGANKLWSTIKDAQARLKQTAQQQSDEVSHWNAQEQEAAKRDANEAAYQHGELGIRGQELEQGRFQWQPGTENDPVTGQPITGMWRLPTRGGDAPQFMPNDNLTSKSGSGQSGISGRESVYFNRVTQAGNAATAAAKNIMELPVVTDRGLFGGRQQGPGLLDATKEDLANTVTGQDAQSYNTMMAGVSRNLAAIEASGLAPNGSLSHSMDSLVIKPGDTQDTKLRKMAEMRQIVETGLSPNLANPRIPAEQKQLVQGIISQMQQAIPFTQHDITQMEVNQNPQMTIRDVMKQKGLGGNTSGTGQIVATKAQYDALPSGTVYTGKDGKQYRKP